MFLDTLRECTHANRKAQEKDKKKLQDAKAGQKGAIFREITIYWRCRSLRVRLAPFSWIRDDLVILPSVAYPDMVNYLVFSPSPYTAEDLKSYKGLEAYNQMVCGWVREMQYQVINDRCVVVKAKVSNAIMSLINLTYSKCCSRSVLLVQPETRQ